MPLNRWPSWCAARSSSQFEVAYLRIERALEGRPSDAAVDVGGKAPVAGNDVGVLQDPEHRGHHQIPRREAVAIKIRFVAERLGESGKALLHELHRTRAPQLGPFLIGVEEIDQGYIQHEGFDGVERGDKPLRRPRASLGLFRQQRLAPLANVEDDGSRLEEHEAVLLEHRDLAERLQSPILRRVLIALLEEARPVGQAGLLQRPARAQIAHLTLSEVRNPFEGRNRDHWYAPFGWCADWDVFDLATSPSPAVR